MKRRIAFNLADLSILGLLLNHRQLAVSATSRTLPPLAIELRNARALPGTTPSIAVDFVMKNNTDQPMKLAERWNSWGAFQWEYEITDAKGEKYILKNSQINRTKNYLSFFEIESGSEFLLPSSLGYLRLFPKYNFVNAKNIRRDNADHDLRGGWKYPITIVGRFRAKQKEWQFGRFARPEEKEFYGLEVIHTHTKRSSWSGDITTEPIRVEAPLER